MNKYLLFVFLYVTSAFTQTQSGAGRIKGKITDQMTREGIPSATVLITGTSLGTSSDSSGSFELSSLEPNSYQIHVSAIGYAPVIRTNIIVTNSSPIQVNIQLAEDVLQLSEISVTADYFDRNPLQLNSITSFGYEEIRRSPGGFEDVIRALSVLPGVVQVNAGRNDLIVRGGAPSENLYLVDGYELSNINHFGTQGASGGPLSFVNLDFVNETSFSTGGFPVLYGDKLSSVLKIDLRDGRSDKIGGKATISASQFGLNLEGPVNQSSQFIFSARRSYLDFIFKAAGFGFVPEYWDFLTKYDYVIDSKNSISFLTVTALDNVKFFNDTPDQKFKNSQVLGSDQIQYIAGLSYRKILPKGYLKLYLSKNYVDFDTRQSDSLQNPIFLNKSKEVENKFKLEYVRKLNEMFELSAGGDARYINFDADVKLPTFKTSFGETLPFDSLKKSSNFLKYSIYTNLTTQLTEQLLANVGLRADYFNGIDNSMKVSPRISFSYKVNALVTLSISTGLYYQYPSYIWLTAGNSSLDPIEMRQFILGGDYIFREDANIKIEYYFKKYSKYPSSKLRPYITMANTGAGFAGAEDNFSAYGFEPLLNEGDGTTSGIEFSAQKKLSSIPCYGIFSLTYNKSEFTALDGISRPGTYDQRWIINLSGGYQFSKYWEIATRFRFASGRPYTPFNPDGTQSPVKYNTANIPDLHALDIRVDRRWIFEKQTLITYIDIQNIYNRKNVSGYRLNNRLNKVEESADIGILPSIGVSYEF